MDNKYKDLIKQVPKDWITKYTYDCFMEVKQSLHRYLTESIIIQSFSFTNSPGLKFHLIIKNNKTGLYEVFTDNDSMFGNCRIYTKNNVYFKYIYGTHKTIQQEILNL